MSNPSPGTAPDEHELADPREVERADALGYGISLQELTDWHPFQAFEVHLAHQHGLAAETARSWLAHGLPVRETVTALALRMVPEDIAPWTAAGFMPGDAVTARESQIPLKTASAWLEAGFTFPDALLLLEDGWSLADATEARYADLGRTRRS